MISFSRQSSAAILAFAVLATPVIAQSAYPNPTSRTAKGDWIVECFEPNSAGQECQLYQRVLINNGKAIAMVVTLAYGPPSQTLYIQTALPLGISVKDGANITIGSEVSINVKISRCTQQGCLFEGVVTKGLENALRRGTSATITVVNPKEGNFAIPLSLVGFPQALNQIAPPPPPQPVATPETSEPVDPALLPEDDGEVVEETPTDNTLRPVTSGN